LAQAAGARMRMNYVALNVASVEIPKRSGRSGIGPFAK
jgi:hypothetical protein